MDNNTLVRLVGFPATLIHGDTLVLDRWLWLRKRLPRTMDGRRLLDVGCGSGAFTIGAALRGYVALGLSFDERNNQVAIERAQLCRASGARFRVCDVRHLGRERDLIGQFDVIICLETIEHIMNDKTLICDMANCLRPGGRLLLTTPYFYYKPITRSDDGPFSSVETGWHVRRGYTTAILKELCQIADLEIEEISYCSGVVSQKITWILRSISHLNHRFGWLSILPLRIVPPVLDRMITALTGWPYFSICLEAYKPRYSAEMIQIREVA